MEIKLTNDVLTDKKKWDEGLKEDEALIKKNPKAFGDDFVPNDIPCREKNLKLIRKNLVSRNNMKIFGMVGVGKSVSIKYAFEMCRTSNSPFFKNTRFVYHDCKHSTPKSIFTSIGLELGMPINRNIALSEISKQLIAFARKRSIEIIYLCLDEIDKIEHLFRIDPEFLHQFSLYKEFRLITITNKSGFYDRQKESQSKMANDRFRAELIEFKPYTIEEMCLILKHRSLIGFEDNSTISDEEIIMIVNAISESENTIRQGIYLLERVYDFKKRENITENLDRKNIDDLLITVVKNSQLIYYEESLHNLLKLCVRVIVYLLKDKDDKRFSIKQLVQYWDYLSQKNNIIKRKEGAIRILLKELENDDFIKITNPNSRKFIYEPTFELDVFHAYIEKTWILNSKLKNIEILEEDIEGIFND